MRIVLFTVLAACEGPKSEELPALARDVIVGINYACALTREDSIVCWGDDVDAFVVDPSIQVKYLEEGGGGTFCYIDADGALGCMARDADGEERMSAVLAGAPPPPLEAIELTYSRACALDSSGVATCWRPESLGARIPSDLRFQAIDVGGLGMCGLLVDGTVRCFCDTDDCQLNEGLPDGVWSAIAVGGDHGCTLDVEGMPWTWGRDVWTYPPEGLQLVDVDADSGVNCGVEADGDAVCWVNWDWEPDGEPEEPLYEDAATEIMEYPAAAGEYVDVVLGGIGSGALITAEGDVVMFGWPISGSFREAAAAAVE